MSSTKPRALIAVSYEAAAQAYLRSLPPEHFMEAIGQATQREITLESLALLKARRPDLHVFNEMLVQYPVPGRRKPRQVVPDNMVVLSDQPIGADSSFNLPLEPAGPYWVLEYVSRSNKRKDYEESFDQYERELKVPYYLVFYPDAQELTLYRHTGEQYVSVKPNQQGRLPMPQLDLEMGLLDGWVRFWHAGQLLQLPADFQRNLDDAWRVAEEQRQRADSEQRRADEEQRRADEEQRRAVRSQQLADDQLKRADELQERLLSLERELAEIRGQEPGSA